MSDQASDDQLDDPITFVDDPDPVPTPEPTDVPKTVKVGTKSPGGVNKAINESLKKFRTEYEPFRW